LYDWVEQTDIIDRLMSFNEYLADERVKALKEEMYK
jgi:hypothetical protein